MKETGIIMSGDHPKLILDGIKTQTRRVIKDPRRRSQGFMSIARYGEGRPSIGDLQRELELTKDTPPNFPCPYGQVGDRLYVKETWASWKCYDHLKPSEIPDTAKIYYVDIAKYRAGGYSLFVEMGKVRPSMFMCKWMTRIWTEITGLRAERLQEISEEDAKAEGVTCCPDAIPDYRHHFMILWDSLNAKRGHGWDRNDWVWPISVKVIAE